jgi:hypothetical protein
VTRKPKPIQLRIVGGGELGLDDLRQLMERCGVSRLYMKRLSPNDNNKNQFYLGAYDLTELNILPVSEFSVDDPNPKAPLELYWLGRHGTLEHARHAQVILYKAYPEMRLSGLIRGCATAPDTLLGIRSKGRLLFLGVRQDHSIIAYAVDSSSAIASDVRARSPFQKYGVLEEIPIGTPLDDLLQRLADIHRKGWITGWRLRADGTIVRPYAARNAGGTTLEAELGIAANSSTVPDYKGIEVKQLAKSSRATLMTPEPTGGYYLSAGVEAFIRRFGKAQPGGKRWDFTGPFIAGVPKGGHGISLRLDGWKPGGARDAFDRNGHLTLATAGGVDAAEWRFTKLLGHWAKKHAQAVYVNSERDGDRFRFGPTVLVGEGTSFLLFLRTLANGKTIYDPGLKLTLNSGHFVSKTRHQFRIRQRDLTQLYFTARSVDIS